MEPETSLELIERAQTGDAAAMERLLTRYRPRLRRWASGRLPRYAREISDTEDLVQEAMIGAVRNFGSFECRGEWALSAYLRRAVSNRIKDEIRKVSGRPRSDVRPETMAATDASPLEVAAGREVFTAYESGLARLDEIEREAVIARLELGCSWQEIALLVQKPSVDAARMTVTRAIDKLARYMP